MDFVRLIFFDDDEGELPMAFATGREARGKMEERGREGSEDDVSWRRCWPRGGGGGGGLESVGGRLRC